MTQATHAHSLKMKGVQGGSRELTGVVRLVAALFLWRKVLCGGLTGREKQAVREVVRRRDHVNLHTCC